MEDNPECNGKQRFILFCYFMLPCKGKLTMRGLTIRKQLATVLIEG